MSSGDASPGAEATAFARSLAGEHFPASTGQLFVEGTSARELADKYGTPLFVYSGGAIDSACERVRGCLPEGMAFYYSVKANPTLAIVERIRRQCDGLEIASVGELALALEAGGRPEKILFAGPGKSDDELRDAVQARIGEIHVESLGEIERLNSIALRCDQTVRISVRVNPAATVQGGGMRMGGRATAFGIDEAQLPAAIEAIKKSPSLHLGGLHLFAGTQVLDANVLIAQYRHALGLARRIAESIGRPLQSIDFGGGWGVPLFPGDQPLNTDLVKAGLSEVMAEIECDPQLAGLRPMIEPGRYLTAASGLYIARVIDVKTSYGTKFAILDGGMNHHLAASGNLGQTIKRNFPIAVLNRWNESPVEPVEIAGPLCTPLDTLARKAMLPRIEPGDLVGVFQSGAYARSASPTGFLSHPAPPEVLVDGASHQMIRRRGTPEDHFRDQRIAGLRS